jgi:hypothetical protein
MRAPVARGGWNSGWTKSSGRLFGIARASVVTADGPCQTTELSRARTLLGVRHHTELLQVRNVWPQVAADNAPSTLLIGLSEHGHLAVVCKTHRLGGAQPAVRRHREQNQRADEDAGSRFAAPGVPNKTVSWRRFSPQLSPAPSTAFRHCQNGSTRSPSRECHRNRAASAICAGGGRSRVQEPEAANDGDRCRYRRLSARRAR